MSWNVTVEDSRQMMPPLTIVGIMIGVFVGVFAIVGGIAACICGRRKVIPGVILDADRQSEKGTSLQSSDIQGSAAEEEIPLRNKV